MPEMIEVESSNLKAIGYDPDTQSLYVDFLNNSRYRYLDVPEALFNRFLSSDSKGKFLHREIKLAGYEYEHLK